MFCAASPLLYLQLARRVVRTSALSISSKSPEPEGTGVSHDVSCLSHLFRSSLHAISRGKTKQSKATIHYCGTACTVYPVHTNSTYKHCTIHILCARSLRTRLRVRHSVRVEETPVGCECERSGQPGGSCVLRGVRARRHSSPYQLLPLDLTMRSSDLRIWKWRCTNTVLIHVALDWNGFQLAFIPS